MEIGVKFWVVFRPKACYNNRQYLHRIASRITNLANNMHWLKKHCDAEVITIKAGDLLYGTSYYILKYADAYRCRIIPPGCLHAVYTPVASFSTGGHFYHYSCMHLTELARYIDTVDGDATTNQDLHHALETLRRMLIAIPRLSRSIGKHG